MSETETQSVPPMRVRIAEEIRALLARRRLSASELARQIGATQPFISRRLTGDIAFDVDDLEKIAAVLNVEIADLLPPPREGRLITAAGTRGNDPAVTNARKTQPPARSPITSYPSRTVIDTSTHRPGRILQAQAA